VNDESRDLWERARDSLRAAEALLPISADAAASRAYYAAFFAVSALFALEGRTFRRHSAVEAAVHRDLVRTGRWPAERGATYARLFELRQTGDYGVGEHVTPADARQAAEAARDILAAVAAEGPEEFAQAGGDD
jgi:uncharacterized protein (UPF0332 family)